MNRQEVFDKVATHLLTQMKKSMDDDNCLYRGPRGLRCAIGCLIPHELIKPSINTKIVNELPLKILRRIGVQTDEDIEFLRQLQRIHDREVPDNWKLKLYNFAKYNNLAWNIPD